MKILIVDDEKPARDRLQRLLAGLSEYSVVGTAQNGQDALQQCDRFNPDIVLMDIRMPVMDGLEAALHLSREKAPPAIIFTTAFSDHALEAFEAHAVDYLLKPVKQERLAEALAASSKRTRAQMQDTLEEVVSNDERQHICARVRGNLVLIPLDDIYYFRAEQKYVTVRHGGGEVLIEEPLKSLEQEFSEDFRRIHRNALVRFDKVAGMKNNPEGHQLFFNDIEDTLEISRRHLSGIRKLLKSL